MLKKSVKKKLLARLAAVLRAFYSEYRLFFRAHLNAPILLVAVHIDRKHIFCIQFAIPRCVGGEILKSVFSPWFSVVCALFTRSWRSLDIGFPCPGVRKGNFWVHGMSTIAYFYAIVTCSSLTTRYPVEHVPVKAAIIGKDSSVSNGAFLDSSLLKLLFSHFQ